MLKIKNYTKTFLAATLGVFLFASCSSNDSNVDTPPNNTIKPYTVTLAYAPASGYDFSYYTVPFKDLMSGTLNAKGKGVEQVGYFDYKKIGQTVYSIGGLNDVKVSTIQHAADGTLKVTGNISFAKSLSDIVQADDSKFVAVALNDDDSQIHFYQIEPNSLTVTNTVSSPVSNLVSLDSAEGLKYTGMAIVNHKIFISYYISNVNTFATTHTNQAVVAVYSYPDFQFEKVITDNRVGPIGGFNLKHGLVEDEDGNVYAISHSNPANGFSQSTKPSGILKIDAGTSEFNPNYFFNISDATNGGNATHVVYLGNGRAFAEINVTPRADQGAWKDGKLKSAVINFEAQTAHFISGIPEHYGHGRRLATLVDGNTVYLPITGDNTINFYKINTTDFTAQKGATVAANFVAATFKH